MKKVGLQFKLSVFFLKEKNRFVAHSPALDLSTSGKTFEEARKRFVEAAVIFFEEIEKRGTTAEALESLGWERGRKDWKPPVVISEQAETISVPAMA